METLRGHNEGSLFQRKTGRHEWVALVTMRDGRRVSRYAKDKDAAKAELAELLRLRDAGAPFTGRVRLSDYLERWVNEEHGWAPATKRKHKSAIDRHLVPNVGQHRLSELSPSDVDAVLVQLGATLSGRSVSHARATLRRALADAIRDGTATRNAAALARPPKLPHTERTILDAAQARTLIESTRGTRYGPLWTILVTTGLRISEALGLAWSDIDWGGNDATRPEARDAGTNGGPTNARYAGGNRRVVVMDDGDDRQRLPGAGRSDRGQAGPSITVRHQLAREDGEWVRRPPKTAKGRRTIPLTPLGIEALRAQGEMQDADRGDLPRPIEGLVFQTEKGNPLHATNLLPKLRADLAAAGLQKVGLHDLRHTAATILITHGYPIEKVAKILGHTTPRITAEIYLHLTDKDIAGASDVMERALG